ncbi:MAG: hypothetical protein Q7R41_19665 [Phycisphaerales bacterium]|nr:hypothetical protein [Phycisphaerales bacterium]
MTGYGRYPESPTPTNERNHTQQTHTGPYQQKVGTVVQYLVDTTSGNSGSPVEHLISGLVYAIHTHGGCTDPGGANQGTAIDRQDLQDAIACPKGVCADCNGNGILDQCDLNCASPCGGCNVPGCGESSDCNSNSVPDECDIASGTSPDCNENGVPDECQHDPLEGACCLPWPPPPHPVCVDNLSQCACEHFGGGFWGAGSKCISVNCLVDPPDRPEGP